ncbi:MAG: AraC family transcriptional regulator [Rubrivivax sp.]|nr:AraC family transcriptional regulator [Rubrivivax sp.]
MAGLSNLANSAYVERLNRAIDHVLAHLDGPLRLDEIAAAAAFSPFHFHRIFRALTGETVNDFVRRLRLDRALQMMAHRPGVRLTEVALACGFASSSDFSRAFRQRHGVAPSRFDLAGHRRRQRDQLARAVRPDEPQRLASLPEGDNPDGFAVRLVELPPRRLACLRVLRPYEGTGVMDACTRLLAWAQARGLAGGQWLGWQWEDPEVVPLEQCRYDVGLVVPEGAALDGAVHELRFPAMRVAELAIAGPIELEMRALDWLFKTWLPRSGHVPDQQPGFEAWDGAPFAHGTEHFELRLQLPVVPH